MTSQVIIATPMLNRFPAPTVTLAATLASTMAAIITLASLAAIPLLGVQGSGSKPEPADYPANTTQHDVTIAVKPIFDTPAAEEIFGKDAAPTPAGFLPVEIVVWNNRVNAIEIEVDSVIIYSSEGRFEQVDPEFVALNLYPPPRRKIEDPTQKTPTPNPLPIPLPRRSKKRSKDKKRQKRELAEAELRRRWLRFGQAASGGTLRGYLYFDLRKASIDPAEAVVMISSVRDKGTGERLPFSEISLRPYE